MRFANPAIRSSSLLSLLLFAGCSGEKRGPPDVSVPVAPSTSMSASAAPAPLRRDFVVMRELVRQHELQAGNELRTKAVEKSLREKFPALPDGDLTEEERTIFLKAEKLFHTISREEQSVGSLCPPE